jgi:hypothetical protein
MHSRHCFYVGHMVLLDTSLLVDAVTDMSKLPWDKYLNGQ